MIKTNKKISEIINIEYTKSGQKICLKDSTAIESIENMKKIKALIENNEELRNFDFFLKRK